MAYRYTPAFVAFVGGAPLEEIAEQFNIPIESLSAKIRQEGWKQLATRLPGHDLREITLDDTALRKCEANRARNFAIANKLSEDLMEIITALRAGTLRIKKQFNYKGEVVFYEVEPNIQDRVAIATYATQVANLSYRALGDHVANGGYRANAGPGEAPPSPPLTIILPEVISKPRCERALPLAIESPKQLSA